LTILYTPSTINIQILNFLTKGLKKCQINLTERSISIFLTHILYNNIIYIMNKSKLKVKNIETQVKDTTLVEQRRREIVEAAVRLFIKKGFHKTTTREIAKVAGFSIGSLYEYIGSKEDVLFLVCDAILVAGKKNVAESLKHSQGKKDDLSVMIREYFLVCDKMSDYILLVYQETKSLPLKWQKVVLEKDTEITGLFIEAFEGLIKSGVLPQMDKLVIELLAQNIAILGHMWALRRWSFAGNYNIEEYAKIQTDFIYKACIAK